MRADAMGASSIAGQEAGGLEYFIPGVIKLPRNPTGRGHNECESSKTNTLSVAFLGSFITPGTK
jgi:predicted butyrate kinase (DUF1464 family)